MNDSEYSKNNAISNELILRLYKCSKMKSNEVQASELWDIMLIAWELDEMHIYECANALKQSMYSYNAGCDILYNYLFDMEVEQHE